MDCSQSCGSCNLPVIGDPTTGNHFLLGTFPIPLAKICQHVGQVGEKENHSEAGKQHYNPKQALSQFISPKDITHGFQVLPWAGELEWQVSIGKVFVCTEVTVGICRTRVREWLVTIRNFSMENLSKAVSEPFNPLLPKLNPLSTSACSSGTLGVIEPGEK